MTRSDNNRVLLTGASGFVGRQILSALVGAGVQVIALARRIPPDCGIEACWLAADLHDTATLRTVMTEFRPTICVHSAWSVKERDFWRSDDNLDWVSSSLNLAKTFVQTGGRRFVGVGTQAEYVDSGGICIEGSTATPGSSLYGIAKDSARCLIQKYCRDRDVAFAWTRIFSVFGAGEEIYKLVPSVIRSIARNEDALISSGRAVRDFIDVRDVGEAIARVALSNFEGPVNIGTGTGVTIADMATRIASLMNRPNRLRIGALPDRPDEAGLLIAEITRLRDEIGVVFNRSLDSSLLDAIAYWTKEC